MNKFQLDVRRGETTFWSKILAIEMGTKSIEALQTDEISYRKDIMHLPTRFSYRIRKWN